ncbi:family 1 glycosylhydrolase [Deinococcus sp.]|uniref:family 1 glycosylhydrolase n=1 Tax=Deinococcus sp. TaxID=47478 RepID=UPI003B5AEA75
MATKENFIAATERLGVKVNGQRLTRKDEFAGHPGSHGEGKPSGSPGNFLFATGIECSYPTIQHGAVRRDQLRECGHYEHYQRDFELVADLGLKYLRYGLPYYSVNPAPGVYDWTQADELMEALRGSGVTPILDLLHFGVPDHLGNFQNPELPAQFAAYAGEVARRYPWVRFFTPVNEVFVTARSSARDGLWNEQLSSETAFITAIKHGVAASCLACQAIVQERPDAVFIQSESAEHLHDACAEERGDLRLHNKMNVVALDLLYAHPPDAEVYRHLRAHGMTEAEYQWFMECEPPGHHIIGNDYYGRNERIILPDRSEIQGQEVLGWGEFARRFYQRYRKPVMHTETNTFDAAENPAWLWRQWMTLLNLRQQNVPVVGFTWYSLTDQIDWDTSLGELNGRVNAVGLYDLQRSPRPVQAAYRLLLEQFGQMPLLPHDGMFDLSAQPALIKARL